MVLLLSRNLVANMEPVILRSLVQGQMNLGNRLGWRWAVVGDGWTDGVDEIVAFEGVG